MVSNVCPVSGREGQMEAILAEVDKCTAYNRLDSKSALRVRLLAEELVSMLPELMKFAEGKFWIENDEKAYELHVAVHAKNADYDTRERVLSVSKTGKNIAAVGIMGRIRAVAQYLLYPDDAPAEPDLVQFDESGLSNLNHCWTLRQYETYLGSRQEKQKEAWDELEKSIIAKLADDVKVGIRGSQVEIILQKNFA